MSIKSHLLAVQKTYQYRIKTVVPLDDPAMDRLERTILKYDPVDVSRPKKTVFQAHPLDFSDVQNTEVYIVDIVLGLPASSYVLQQEIRNALNIPEKFIVVRGDNEQTEVETQRLNAIHDIEKEAKQKGLKRAALLTASAYEEVVEKDGADLYGDDYNSRLLGYLKTVEDERVAMQVDAPSPLFRWLDVPDRTSQEPVQSDADFNAHIKGDSRDGRRTRTDRISDQGNLDDNAVSVTRLHRKEDGTLVPITSAGTPVRKGGKNG